VLKVNILGDERMPVILDSTFTCSSESVRAKLLRSKSFSASEKQPSKHIAIGLINNMPDGALEATERQFISLLDAASEGIQINLSFHALHNVPRNEAGTRYVRDLYSNVDGLWNKKLDGLIVTGREPLTANLKDEPYWQSFIEVLEWAKDNTHSTVWSCLAAHAAVLHMDGIGRIRNRNKYCGVFECTRQADHLLTIDAPSSFRLPHSRWNGLPEEVLTSHGYSVLTRSEEAGVDTFTKQLNSLFIFFQGHPEYEPNTLMLEYRRDVGRYLRGETNTYPLMPLGYFDDSTTAALTTLQTRAESGSCDALLADLTNALEESTIENAWHSTAVCIYRNWLNYIWAQKQSVLTNNTFTVPSHAVDSLAPILVAPGSVPSSFPGSKARLAVQ
jgi:homoserine O-succinyltransferase